MSYSTMGDVPDIFRRANMVNGYEKKSMERSWRHEAAISLFRQTMPGHVSQMRGEVGQATLGKASPLANLHPTYLQHRVSGDFASIYQWLSGRCPDLLLLDH